MLPTPARSPAAEDPAISVELNQLIRIGIRTLLVGRLEHRGGRPLLRQRLGVWLLIHRLLLQRRSRLLNKKPPLADRVANRAREPTRAQ